MEQPESRDLTSISFNDFVSLVFNSAEQVKPDTPVSDFKIEIVDGTKYAATTHDCSKSQNFCYRALQNRSLKKGSGKSLVTRTIGPSASSLVVTVSG